MQQRREKSAVIHREYFMFAGRRTFGSGSAVNG